MATIERGWFGFYLYKTWKWLRHLFTGKCEIERICTGYANVVVRTMLIISSLRLSKHAPLRRLVTKETDHQKMLDAIARVKKLKRSANWNPRLEVTCLKLAELNIMKRRMAQLKSEAYSMKNRQHEQDLEKLWKALKPSVTLEDRITKQWGDIGFQGDNPATDFRGMGILSLKCMLYYGSKSSGECQRLLGHSFHPVHGYPFAVTGINLTSLAVELTESCLLDRQYVAMETEGSGDEDQSMEKFYRVFCIIFRTFDAYWIASKPENIMSFNIVREQYKQDMKMHLNSHKELSQFRPVQ